MLASYVARLGLVWARSLGGAPLDPLGEVRMSLRAWPTDVDTYLHVNNGRYLTLMDFGRFQHSIRTGLMGAMLRNRWRPILGAATVQFRRELRPLQRFELVTRLVAWDEKWFYIEHRFERGGELLARGLVRGVLKKGRQTIPPSSLLEALGRSDQSPAPSEALRRWIEMQTS